MKIAIDYTTGIYPGAGVARYTRSLVGALAEMDAHNEYALFYAGRGLPRPTPETAMADELFRRHGNVRAAPVPPSKITVAYNGVDSRFKPGIGDRGSGIGAAGHLASLRRSPIPDPRSPIPFILHVGTLEPRKNLVRLVEAYGRLVSANRVGEV